VEEEWMWKMAVGSTFWGDAWCGHSPLKDKFPEFFDICNE
jgi:hypothetical protein